MIEPEILLKNSMGNNILLPKLLLYEWGVAKMTTDLSLFSFGDKI
jgi:hypothetical protein